MFRFEGFLVYDDYTFFCLGVFVFVQRILLSLIFSALYCSLLLFLCCSVA